MFENRNLKFDLITLVLLAATALLAVSVLSYDPADPPSTLVYPSPTEFQNACGPIEFGGGEQTGIFAGAMTVQQNKGPVAKLHIAANLKGRLSEHFAHGGRRIVIAGQAVDRHVMAAEEFVQALVAAAGFVLHQVTG